jgi:hypothetical protein
MAGKAADLLELARDILLTARLDDRARFTQMVAETKAGMESGASCAAVPLGCARLRAHAHDGERTHVGPRSQRFPKKPHSTA